MLTLRIQKIGNPGRPRRWPPARQCRPYVRDGEFANLSVDEWEFRVTNEILAWVNGLDPRSKALVVHAIDRLADAGPSLGRPLVDHLAGSEIHNLKE
ncbi:hypothetical protein [Frankia sp. Cj5]|uniref:hypothetical protein n=1 Tax=Frankia sp. Cj5 TaxID=2880978 RepID=UPI00351CE09E